MSGSHAITLDSIVVQAATIASAQVGEEIVMLHLDKNAYYDTDAIGAEIWRRLSQPVLVRDLRDALLELYDVDVQTCEADVFAFLNEACQEGVIRVLESGSGEPAS